MDHDQTMFLIVLTEVWRLISTSHTQL